MYMEMLGIISDRKALNIPSFAVSIMMKLAQCREYSQESGLQLPSMS